MDCTIAGAFDLDLRQHDAFVNSMLPTPVYCYCPEGFGRPGYYWMSLRALYGLKQAPLLWFQEFSSALEELGLYPVPNCLFINGTIILFFYVDDTVTLCPKGQQALLKDFETRLCNRFDMRSLGELKWFLGIRILRDSINLRKIWLTQDSYNRTQTLRPNGLHTKDLVVLPQENA